MKVINFDIEVDFATDKPLDGIEDSIRDTVIEALELSGCTEINVNIKIAKTSPTKS